MTLGITLRFDEIVLQSINTYATPALDTLFKTVTDFGGVAFISLATLLVCVGLLAQKNKRAALFVALSVGGVALVHALLKLIFERSRPDLWEWLVTETTYSFPSGHASASMALALCIVLLMWHTKWRVSVTVLAALYVFTVALSRMYLGLHYPTDILGGWLLAVAGVTFVAWAIKLPLVAQKESRV